MENRGRQIFSKIVRASKLTRQRTVEILKQRSPCSRGWQHFRAFARSDKESFLIHSELTETNKVLLFFSELGSNLNFWRFLLNRWCKGGNFIYPMMHRFILYYQASERTWCYQSNKDVTVEQQWKATCSANKTFCTFAVSIYLRFSFYYSKYISS